MSVQSIQAASEEKTNNSRAPLKIQLFNYSDDLIASNLIPSSALERKIRDFTRLSFDGKSEKWKIPQIRNQNERFPFCINTRLFSEFTSK